MASFEKTLRAVNDLKATGIIDEYAIAGAMALVFWIDESARRRFVTQRSSTVNGSTT